MSGEPARGRGRHGIVGSIEPLHARSPERQSAGQRQQDIDAPNPLGRRRQPGVHLGAHGASSLGSEHLDTSAHERGKHGNGEEDDTQSANPLHERPPEQDAMRQCLHIVDDRGTRGGESRHRFEISIGETIHTPVDEEREHAKEREDHPDQRDHHVGIATAQGVLGLATEVEKDEGRAEGEQRRHEKSQHIILLEDKRHDETP